MQEDAEGTGAQLRRGALPELVEVPAQGPNEKGPVGLHHEADARVVERAAGVQGPEACRVESDAVGHIAQLSQRLDQRPSPFGHRHVLCQLSREPGGSLSLCSIDAGQRQRRRVHFDGLVHRFEHVTLTLAA